MWVGLRRVSSTIAYCCVSTSSTMAMAMSTAATVAEYEARASLTEKLIAQAADKLKSLKAQIGKPQPLSSTSVFSPSLTSYTTTRFSCGFLETACNFLSFSLSFSLSRSLAVTTPLYPTTLYHTLGFLPLISLFPITLLL